MGMLVLVESAFCTIAISHGAAGAGGKLSQNDSAVLDLDRLHTDPLGHKAPQFAAARPQATFGGYSAQRLQGGW